MKKSVIALGPVVAIVSTTALAAPEFFNSAWYWPFAVLLGVIGGAAWLIAARREE